MKNTPSPRDRQIGAVVRRLRRGVLRLRGITDASVGPGVWDGLQYGCYAVVVINGVRCATNLYTAFVVWAVQL